MWSTVQECEYEHAISVRLHDFFRQTVLITSELKTTSALSELKRVQIESWYKAWNILSFAAFV